MSQTASEAGSDDCGQKMWQLDCIAVVFTPEVGRMVPLPAFLRAVFPVLKWQEWENDKKLDKFAKKFKLPLLKFGILWHNRWEGSLTFVMLNCPRVPRHSRKSRGILSRQLSRWRSFGRWRGLYALAAGLFH